MQIKHSLIVGLAAILLSGCYTQKKSLEAAGAAYQKFNWPEEYQPEASRFFVFNEIEIAAPPQVVWEHLVRAEEWPGWYPGAEEVVIQKPGGAELDAGSVFDWRTMGLRFTSVVRECGAPYRLSWESSRGAIRGYHSWLIEPTEKGCRVMTAESQKGWLTFLEKTFQPRKLHRLHGIWLMNLKERSESALKEMSP